MLSVAVSLKALAGLASANSVIGKSLDKSLDSSGHFSSLQLITYFRSR